MAELENMKEEIRPHEILLVVDAMTAGGCKRGRNI
jgi:signal recognition particle GTPase